MKKHKWKIVRHEDNWIRLRCSDCKEAINIDGVLITREKVEATTDCDKIMARQAAKRILK